MASGGTGYYNILVANKLGLNAAVYLDMLLNAQKKAADSKSFANGGFFKVDRPNIAKTTTIQKKEQKSLDAFFVKLKFLSIDKSNDSLLKIDTDAMIKLLIDDSKVINERINPVSGDTTSKDTQESKRASVKRQLMSHIATDNEELRAAYAQWIDAVQQKSGYMTAQQVMEGQRVIDAFSNHNLDIALELLRIGMLTGYRNVDWIITTYEKDHRRPVYNNYNSNKSINVSLKTHAGQEHIEIGERKEVEFTDEEF